MIFEHGVLVTVRGSLVSGHRHLDLSLSLSSALRCKLNESSLLPKVKSFRLLKVGREVYWEVGLGFKNILSIPSPDMAKMFYLRGEDSSLQIDWRIVQNHLLDSVF